MSSISDNLIYTRDIGRLTLDQRLFYEKNGYIVIPQLVSLEILKKCSQRFDGIASGKVDKGHITVMKDITDKKSVNKVQDLNFDEVFRQFVEYKKILDIVEAFVGPNIIAAHSMLIAKPPDAGSRSSSSQHSSSFQPTSENATDRAESSFHSQPPEHPAYQLHHHQLYQPQLFQSQPHYHSLQPTSHNQHQPHQLHQNQQSLGSLIFDVQKLCSKFNDFKKLVIEQLSLMRHPPHQDLYYFPFRPPNRIVAAWTAIERCDTENGCLFVSPGSHTINKLLPHTYPRDSDANNKFYHGIQELPDSTKWIDLEMEPGDTAFFHPLLIHGSGVNRSNRTRKAISCHYAAAECHYIDLTGTVQEDLKNEILEMIGKKYPGLDVDYSTIWRFKSSIVRGIRSIL